MSKIEKNEFPEETSFEPFEGKKWKLNKSPNILISQLISVSDRLEEITRMGLGFDGTESPELRSKYYKLAELLIFLANKWHKVVSAVAKNELPLDDLNDLLIEIMDKLKGYERKYPELKKLYAQMLSSVAKERSDYIDFEFTEAIDEEKVDNSVLEKLKERVVFLNRELTSEAAEKIREIFPEGNFMLHTTSLHNALLIIESGDIQTANQVSAIRQEENWSSGAYEGIAFNFNDVRVFLGGGSSVGFLVAPEEVVSEEYKLSLPKGAAKYEVQLVPKDWSIEEELVHFDSEKPSRLPTIDVESTVIFCNQRILNQLLKFLAQHHIEPRLLLVYPSAALRVSSWTNPTGDYKIAGKMLKNVFDKVGLQPSLNWWDLLPEREESEIKNDTYVKEDAVRSSKSIVKTKEGLQML